MALSVEGWTHLEPKVKTLWLVQAGISGVIMTVIFGVVGTVIQSNADESLTVPVALIGIAVGLLLGVIKAILTGVKYAHTGYQVGDDDLAYASGIFWRTQRFVPRARIQHVDLTAGPIARKLDLVEVSISVGGQPGAAITIPGLAADDGERLRQTLLKTAAKHDEMDDGPGGSPVPEPPVYQEPPEVSEAGETDERA
jgi:membrane protein YdbS with pleckstrin-like domain